MPYDGEKAGKLGHASFIKNEDVRKFLSACSYMRSLNSGECRQVAENFMPAPNGASLPDIVVACDGGSYCAPLNEDKLPSTQVGYVKISMAMIIVREYQKLANPDSAYVDPFKVAQLHKDAVAVSIPLPGANIVYDNCPAVASGFRRAIFEQCGDERTNWVKGEKFSIIDFLFDLCGETIQLRGCPSCGARPDDIFSFERDSQSCVCPACKSEIYVTDILRIHEQLAEFGDNSPAMTRFMNVFEHLLIASLVNMLYRKNRSLLSRMAFILDGPLAIFGQPAKIHARLMSFYDKVRKGMLADGFTEPVIMGAQKNGVLADHCRQINSFVEPETFMLVSDKYRSQYIQRSKESVENFGHETYYGQDIFFKTQKGSLFALALPYPCAKKGDRHEFSLNKSRKELYGDNLDRAFALVREFECDLYSNSLVPVILAHRHASISLMPGGNVLSLLARLELNRHR